MANTLITPQNKVAAPEHLIDEKDVTCPVQLDIGVTCSPPSCEGSSTTYPVQGLEAIATRVEAITLRLEVIAIRLD